MNKKSLTAMSKAERNKYADTVGINTTDLTTKEISMQAIKEAEKE